MLSVDPIGPTTTSAWIEPHDIYPSVQVSHRFANRRVRRTKVLRRLSKSKAARDGKWEQPLGNLHRGLKCAPEVDRSRWSERTRSPGLAAGRRPGWPESLTPIANTFPGQLDAPGMHLAEVADGGGWYAREPRGLRPRPINIPAENGPQPQRRRLPCLSHRQSSCQRLAWKNAEE
jgi:hypothetical protein